VLDVAPARVRVELGDSALPAAPLAGGSMGTASWGSAVAAACEALLKDGSHGRADTAADVAEDSGFARHSFGAQFAEVLVDPLTGEVRVPRLLGVFAAGRIIDSSLARSQFIGGMTMGLGMALMEGTAVDASAGCFVGLDLAQYQQVSQGQAGQEQAGQEARGLAEPRHRRRGDGCRPHRHAAAQLAAATRRADVPDARLRGGAGLSCPVQGRPAGRRHRAQRARRRLRQGTRIGLCRVSC
jgi:CO/xanthine dehydrogenase Mo-binding subunit